MKDLFAQIETLVPAMDGWCTITKAQFLTNLVLAIRPNLCCELGTYAGRSIIPMALAMKYLGKGHCIGIDPYSPEESAKHETKESAEWWTRLEHGAILRQFQHRIIELGLQNVISLSICTSDKFDLLGLTSQIDILHIDGAHGPQALADAKRFCPHVRLGGYVVMDDINWVVGGEFTVRKATDWMANKGFVKLYEVVKHDGPANQPQDDWALFQKQA